MSPLPTDYNLDAPPPAPGRRSKAGWIGLAVLAAALFAYLAYHHSHPVPRGETFRPSLPWLHDADAAMAEARQTGRPALFVFSQPGCVWCDYLRMVVLDSGPFEQAAGGRVVLAELDIRGSDANLGLFLRYGGQATPAVVLADAAGTSLASFQQGRWEDLPRWLNERLADLPTTRPAEAAGPHEDSRNIPPAPQVSDIGARTERSVQ